MASEPVQVVVVPEQSSDISVVRDPATGLITGLQKRGTGDEVGRLRAEVARLSARLETFERDYIARSKAANVAAEAANRNFVVLQRVVDEVFPAPEAVETVETVETSRPGFGFRPVR